MMDGPMLAGPKDDEKTSLYVNFVVRNMWMIATGGSKAEQVQAPKMICSRQERI
jgi:hypothetical protein